MTKSWAFLASVLVLFGSESVRSQSDKQDVAKSIQLGEQRLPEGVLVSFEGAASRGNDDAKVTIIEFSDYQCPYCTYYASQTLPQIMKDYVETGKVKYVFRDSPGEKTHPAAEKAAEAARCAGDQGKFWEMHDRLLGNQGLLEARELPAHAKTVGLDVPAFQACLDSGKYTAAVRNDFEEGQKAGVRATPSFFIGTADAKEQRLKASSLVTGAPPYPGFKEILDKLLSPEQPSDNVKANP
jgi:protein-disulfide isomerase